MKELIIGGVRSGKSDFAEREATDSGLKVIYVATARMDDPEMRERVRRHRIRRPADWGCVEEPVQLASTLQKLSAPRTFILVDCLTLWLTNLFFSGLAAQQAERGEPITCPLLTSELGALADTLPKLRGRIAMVSNEIGLGGVPMERLSRRFADEQGRLNQHLASLCDRVTLVAAGLPLRLKG